MVFRYTTGMSLQTPTTLISIFRISSSTATQVVRMEATADSSVYLREYYFGHATRSSAGTVVGPPIETHMEIRGFPGIWDYRNRRASSDPDTLWKKYKKEIEGFDGYS